MESAVHVDTTDGQSSMDHLENLGASNAPGIGVDPCQSGACAPRDCFQLPTWNLDGGRLLLNGVRRCLISDGTLIADLPGSVGLMSTVA